MRFVQKRKHPHGARGLETVVPVTDLLIAGRQDRGEAP
jgi:hypothetical protein